ncbi:MAG: AAA family ATPase [Proteobacteria bacterium]|nr:AAA family ATPase [Pseudomonadota bacterium]
MYTSFFGLHEKPFTITPDPRYLFMSERHGEGLAHLVYGVTEGGGFIQLTGEVGTGKTTLVRTLLRQIPAGVDIALILNPQLSAREFLATICEELGIIASPGDRHSTKVLTDALNRHLLDAHSRGRRIILLIDEAQNLSEEVLEQLRLLTNLETARQKLLQIILIGQPELRERLAQKNLRQLAQRVTGRYHLEPLSRYEAVQYIDHRLRVAGALVEIFEPAAKREVFRLSAGIPRIMNVICDRALLGAYSRESRVVSKRLVRKAAAEVSGCAASSGLPPWLVPVVGLAGLVVAILLFSPGNNGVESPADEVEDAIPAIESVAMAGDIATMMNGDDAVVMTDDIVEADSVPPAPDIDQILAGVDDAAAFRALLGLWGAKFDLGAGSACEQARLQKLSCSYQKGTWTTLKQLDRPVIMTLTGKDGRSLLVALARLNDGVAELALEDALVSVPSDTLSDYWFGHFILIWRPANGSDQPIEPGMQHRDVSWLRQSLVALNDDYRPADINSTYFDDELKNQLIVFQRQHRLEADGVAGQKTQVILNSLLAPHDTPRLTESDIAPEGL